MAALSIHFSHPTFTLTNVSCAQDSGEREERWWVVLGPFKLTIPQQARNALGSSAPMPLLAIEEVELSASGTVASVLIGRGPIAARQ